jgi:uncharacterized protein (DUF2147 family)
MMNKTRSAMHVLVIGVILALPASALAVEGSPVGIWRTPEQGGLVEVMTCGAGLCGRIVGGSPSAEQFDVHNKDAGLQKRPLKGLTLFNGLVGGPDGWKGPVYNPADGGTYDGTLSLVSANEMKLKGCIVWPLCRSQVWARVR